MAKPQYVECPICDTEIALDGAGPGDEVFCSYCGAPVKIAKIGDDDSIEIDDY